MYVYIYWFYFANTFCLFYLINKLIYIHSFCYFSDNLRILVTIDKD